MQHHAVVPLSGAFRNHHKRDAMQGESVKLDVGIVRISQGSDMSAYDVTPRKKKLSAATIVFW